MCAKHSLLLATENEDNYYGLGAFNGMIRWPNIGGVRSCGVAHYS